MALTPYLAEFGSRLGAVMESSDLKELQPKVGRRGEGGEMGVGDGRGRWGVPGACVYVMA